MLLFCQVDSVNHNIVFHSLLCCLISVWISFVSSGVLIQWRRRTCCSFTLGCGAVSELSKLILDWSSARRPEWAMSRLDSTASHIVYFPVCVSSRVLIANVCVSEPHMRPKQRCRRAGDQLRVCIGPVRWQTNPAVRWLNPTCWMFLLGYCRWQSVKALCKLSLDITVSADGYATVL